MDKNSVSSNSTRTQILKNMLKASIGLFIFGIGLYFTIQANIGVMPWDVLYIGIAEKMGVKYGTVVIILALAVIAVDLLMKEKIGMGTLIDAFLVGKTVDLCMWLDLAPAPKSVWGGIAMMLIGLFIIGLSQALYMSAGLCCGPKDALMVGLGRRITKVPIGVINIGIVCTVLIFGWLLDGPVGIGTLIGAVGMGSTMQLAFYIVKFDPVKVEHQDIVTTMKVLITGTL